MLIIHEASAFCNTLCYLAVTKETVKAKGHSYKVTSQVEKTCTTDGSATYTCSSCGKSYTETVKCTGHRFIRTVEDESYAKINVVKYIKYPSLTYEGEAVCKCWDCGATQTITITRDDLKSSEQAEIAAIGECVQEADYENHINAVYEDTRELDPWQKEAGSNFFIEICEDGSVCTTGWTVSEKMCGTSILCYGICSGSCGIGVSDYRYDTELIFKVALDYDKDYGYLYYIDSNGKQHCEKVAWPELGESKRIQFTIDADGNVTSKTKYV